MPVSEPTSHQSAPGTPRSFEGRATFIDALRGIAALSVACYHINRYGPLPEPAAEVIPRFLQVWFDHGWIGVQVFFVISGFVIAYSARHAWVTPGFLGNYALRRSIRLDPPYWTTIMLVVLIHWVFHLRLGFESPMDVPSPMETPLSWGLIGAHVLYLQNILYDENLSAGFWTLCIEVQFYLLYVIGLGIAQRLPAKNRRAVHDAGGAALLAVFGPLALLSLFWWNLDAAYDMWILHFFCMFFLGCAAWWTLDGRVPPAVFWGYVLLMLARLGFDTAEVFYEDRSEGATLAEALASAALCTIELKVALAAGVAMYLLGRAGRLGQALDYRWLQYLGRVSYSLYLVHFPVAHVVTTLGYEHMVLNNTLTPFAAACWLLAALLTSLAAAHLVYALIEAPSVRLAAHLRRGR